MDGPYNKITKSSAKFLFVFNLFYFPKDLETTIFTIQKELHCFDIKTKYTLKVL